MRNINGLTVKNLTVEHMTNPIGLDVSEPRFGWKLESGKKNVHQTAYQIRLYKENELAADTGKLDRDTSIEVTAEGFRAEPKTAYQVEVTVWDNHGETASLEGCFETGRLGVPFVSGWAEPEQEPTPDSLAGKEMDCDSVSVNAFADQERDFAEFRPAQYVRIPFEVKKGLKKARIYMTAHGIYQVYVNGTRPDVREFAPENTSYHKVLQYQTYDVTSLISEGKNVLGVILADGWWAGRVGVSGDSCQYGNKTGLLLDCDLDYMDGSKETITGEQGKSSTGPILFSDLFVGEKYDAGKEIKGWNTPDFDDGDWIPVHQAEYPMENLTGQCAPPVRVVKTLEPAEIFTTPAGETMIDMGQVMAGILEIELDAPAGIQVKLEHSEVLGDDGNYFNNILGTNKEQTDFYITKEGHQTYRPSFTYHGFRYVRVTGWPGRISKHAVKAHVFSSEMEDIGTFHTSDERLNKLQENIWWSQTANTISIPTDCPQREKAGWTGDIMAYAPTMCFNRKADAFLTSWMANVRADQLDSGAVPDIVPFLKAYEIFMMAGQGSVTSCGWGDAVITVPYAVYQAYGDRRILEENYGAMEKWMDYIADRAANHHPEAYESWDEEHKARSRYLWNTDFHFGDWLIPSIVLGNPDGAAMMQTALATMETVAPAYYAFSAMNMVKVANVLGRTEDAQKYEALYEKIRDAFIKEYVHADGTMDADFQGLYVIALKMGLVTDEVRPLMTEHLCEMIKKNRGCLDTGFLSVLFLMDVLCENGKRDVAYSLLFQTRCPSWLYEVEHGATTMWESWGAVGENGEFSTYSYNHYAFGCVGEWMYKEIGGLQMAEAGYKKLRIAPALDCGLTSAGVSEETPYGKAAVDWELLDGRAIVHVEIPANTTAEVALPGIREEIGSGRYTFTVNSNDQEGL